MNVYQGELRGDGLSIAIAVGRFNELIGKQLLEGALDGLRRLGVADNNIAVAWVPGSFELPIVAQRLARSGTYQAVICLGTVIRGATAHFDFVAGQAAAGIAAASRETGVPIIFGVLTTETIEQALERAGTRAGNRGYDAAVSAVEMANLMRTLPPEV